MKPRSRDPETEPVSVTQFIAEVGERIRIMRLARNKTMAEVAEMAGMSRTTLTAIEKGQLSTRFADVARVLWVLDDQALQQAMASALADEHYQDAARRLLGHAVKRGR